MPLNYPDFRGSVQLRDRPKTRRSMQPPRALSGGEMQSVRSTSCADSYTRASETTKVAMYHVAVVWTLQIARACNVTSSCNRIHTMSKTKRSEIRRRTRPSGQAEPRKSERTRQSILDASLKFLWTHPFRDLTVGELMSLAGTSRSAFYHYFEDLHDLMEALLRGMEEEIFDVTAPWFSGEGDPFRFSRNRWRTWCECATSGGPFCGLFLMPLRWMSGWRKRGRDS